MNNYSYNFVNEKMWVVKEGCYGCGRCTYCQGIEMDESKATIVDQNAECIQQMAEICPAGVIQEV